MTIRHASAAALTLVVLILLWPVVKAVAELGLHDDTYVQILASPFLVLFFLYWEHGPIFREVRWNLGLGIPALSLLLATYFVYLRSQSKASGGVRLILAVCILVLSLMAVFILCYGLRSFQSAWFPLGCLLLMIPVPASMMADLTAGLQHGSASTSQGLLRLFGVPVLAQGTKFTLPGVEIEVAPECSGIHSCLALALVGLMASRVYLSSGWNRLLLVISTFPIAIFKNAIRISVIASLGAYVNPAFLFGRVHRYGGLVFTPLAIVLLTLLLLALQKSETWMAKRLRGHAIVSASKAASTAS